MFSVFCATKKGNVGKDAGNEGEKLINHVWSESVQSRGSRTLPHLLYSMQGRNYDSGQCSNVLQMKEVPHMLQLPQASEGDVYGNFLTFFPS